jgi:hypothetical protein
MELLLSLTSEHLILLESILAPIRESESVLDNDGLQNQSAAVSLLASEIVLRAAQHDELIGRIEVLKRKSDTKKKQAPHTKDEVKTAKKSVQSKSKAVKKQQQLRKKEAAKKSKEAAKKAKDAAKLAAKKEKEALMESMKSAGKTLFGSAPTK